MDEMGETCKLCLKYIQGDTVVALDEDLLAKLDFILMNLERSVEESNSVCTECKEKIQNAYDFKFCLVQTESADPDASGSRTQNVCDIPSTSGGESSTEKTICRLCKNSVAVISVISLEKLFKDDNVMEVFQGHIPEMELQESENSMVCEPCQKALASFSMLISSWSIANDWNEDDDMKEDMDEFGAVDVKTEIMDEFSDSNTNTSRCVDASASGKIVKKSKENYGITEVKTESNEVPDSSESVSVDKDVKKEENEEEIEEADLQLKNEEVEIKDEDGKTRGRLLPKQERFDPDYEPPMNPALRTNSLNKNQQMGQKRIHKCVECPYETKYGWNLKRHTLSQILSEGKKLRNTRKKGILKCEECSYETMKSWNFRRHMINHRPPEERHKLREVMKQIFKCKDCTFEAVDKRNLKRHQITHKSHEERELLKKFKCDECFYKTMSKKKLSCHKLTHKSKEERKILEEQMRLFFCTECSYRTIYSHALKKHLWTHQ